MHSSSAARNTVNPELFHGSSDPIAVGSRLRPSGDGYVYLSPSMDWADAFAFRDSASEAIHEVAWPMFMQYQRHVQPAPGAGLAILQASSRPGVVHTVDTAGSLSGDPDFRTAPESVRTAAPCTVRSSVSGAIASWRRFHEIVGPHQTWKGDTPAYDDEGYVLPPTLWTQWGYSRDDFRALGRWYPYTGLWENVRNRKVILVGDASTLFTNQPSQELRDEGARFLAILGQRLIFSAARARFAGEHWWQ